MKQQSENIDIPEIEEYKNDLFLLIDFLQEKVIKLEAKEEEFVKLKEKLYDFNFEKQSSIDFLNQLNHVQNLLLKKNNDYNNLKFQYKSLIKEVDVIYETLNKYKNLSNEQNEQILRATNLIKKKKFLN
tara:strand:- start:309 stop:695 length:387 start_codon:yes stop_codon:yes gene_type:complete